VIVGMVGTRFAGLDGVSLETAKLATILRDAGHEVVFFAGEIGPGFEPAVEVSEAHFATAENQELERACFGATRRTPQTSAELRRRAAVLLEALRQFVADLSVDVIMPQNALTIPMQLPLGLAITELLLETGMAAVAHHHDFVWERERFSPNAVPDVLSAAFPPRAPGLVHLVINSLAQEELARRTGLVSDVLPNVMPFEEAPEPGDGARFRRHAGVDAGEVLLLQPTRIVPRKAIEDAIELAQRLSPPASIVVSHQGADEGVEYRERLEDLAARLGVDFRVVGVGDEGEPSLADAYAAADLVTYPSRLEGFGNALVEAMYHRAPVLVNRYPVYQRDLAPTGIRAIEMDGAVTGDVVAEAERWLAHPEVAEAAVEHNYRVGLRHFSFAAAARVVLPALDRAAVAAAPS
jgi:glycosyltransferase involved in cell wall biosynthesis